MDFLETIEKYEKQREKIINLKLKKFFDILGHIHLCQFDISNDISAIKDTIIDILSSKKLTQMIINKSEKANKYSIIAKAVKQDKVCNCFEQSILLPQRNNCFYRYNSERNFIYEEIKKIIISNMRMKFNSEGKREEKEKENAQRELKKSQYNNILNKEDNKTKEIENNNSNSNNILKKFKNDNKSLGKGIRTFKKIKIRKKNNNIPNFDMLVYIGEKKNEIANHQGFNEGTGLKNIIIKKTHKRNFKNALENIENIGNKGFNESFNKKQKQRILSSKIRIKVKNNE